MANIIPAILTNDPLVFLNNVNLVKDNVDMIHIDLLDGIYVDEKSLNLESIKECLDKIDSLKPKIEIHMMVRDPEVYADRITQIRNIDSVVLHYGSSPNSTMEEVIAKYKGKNLNVGLSYKLDENLDVTDPKDCSYFLILDVAMGHSGEKFNEKYLDQAYELKFRYPDKIVEIDGGVNENDIPLGLKAGVDRFVVNSSIFKDSNPLEKLKLLQSINA